MPTSRENLVYLSGARIPSMAANCVQTLRMCEAFAGSGRQVTLLARQGELPEEEWMEQFGIRAPFKLQSFMPMGPRGLRTATFVTRVHRMVRSLGPDMLVSRDVWLSLACVSPTIPLVYDAHHVLPEGSASSWAFKAMIRRPGLAGISFITPALRDIFLERYPELAKVHVMVLPNGAADPLGGPVPRRELTEHRRVGYVGHLYEGRGVESVFSAARSLREVEFVLVGGRPQDVKTWRARGVPKNVKMLGHVPHAELARYYTEFDILIAPYARQVFDAQGKDSAAFASPMKLFEYMATGLPIVTSRIPGVEDILRDGETALVVEPDNHVEFTAALRRLIEDRALGTRLGGAARAQYEARHTWGARADRILEALAVAKVP